MPNNRCVDCQESPCACGLEVPCPHGVPRLFLGDCKPCSDAQHEDVGRIFDSRNRLPVELSVAVDNRPATAHKSDNFLLGEIDGADDFRLAAFVPEIETAVKWLAPDGRDLGFTRGELTELHGLIGRALVL